MARRRVIEPGGYYHVGSRGSNRERIYFDDVDRDVWMGLFARVCRRHGWAVLAYTQLTNHFHILLRVFDESLSAGMRELNGVYARKTNERHGRSAHLFESRF